MNQDDFDDMPEDISLLDSIVEGMQDSTTLRKAGHDSVGTNPDFSKAPQSMHVDVFEVMLSLIHGAATLQEQITHLQDMARWLYEEADRLEAIGQGTLLLKNSNMRH